MPQFEAFDDVGIDIRPYLEDAKNETWVSRTPDEFLGPTTKRMLEVTNAIGLPFEPAHRHINFEKCEYGCKTSAFGCKRVNARCIRRTAWGPKRTATAGIPPTRPRGSPPGTLWTCGEFGNSIGRSRSPAYLEVLGEFRAGLSTLLDPQVIAEAVVPDRLELPPVPGLSYRAFGDPSGGRRDAFTCAIGHRDGERGVVDVVRRWPAPFNPSGVIAKAAELLRDYRVSRVVGDRYAGEFAREPFRAEGIAYDVAEKDRSALYLSLLAILNSRRLELPDEPVLLRELRGLERRRGPSERDRVDHAPGAHDDTANAVAGLAHELLGRRRGLSPSDLHGEPTDEATEDEWTSIEPRTGLGRSTRTQIGGR
jgi:hypothetical protein